MPHGADSLLLQLFTIFVWAKVFGELFERMYLPAVLGEILAGVVLGPYATRFIIPGDTIYSIAEIGAVFLLFTVGLETSPSDLIRVGRVSMLVAIAGVVLPFMAGFLFLRARHEVTHEAVFVAAAMVATSVGITMRVLRDLKAHKSRAARIILGAAVFDDILGMLLLGVLVSTVRGGGTQWLHLGIVTAEAIAFALFMIFVAPKVVDRLELGIEGMQTHAAWDSRWPPPTSEWPPSSAHFSRASPLPITRRAGTWSRARRPSTSFSCHTFSSPWDRAWTSRSSRAL